MNGCTDDQILDNGRSIPVKTSLADALIASFDLMRFQSGLAQGLVCSLSALATLVLREPCERRVLLASHLDLTCSGDQSVKLLDDPAQPIVSQIDEKIAGNVETKDWSHPSPVDQPQNVIIRSKAVAPPFPGRPYTFQA